MPTITTYNTGWFTPDDDRWVKLDLTGYTNDQIVEVRIKARGKSVIFSWSNSYEDVTYNSFGPRIWGEFPDPILLPQMGWSFNAVRVWDVRVRHNAGETRTIRFMGEYWTDGQESADYTYTQNYSIPSGFLSSAHNFPAVSDKDRRGYPGAIDIYALGGSIPEIETWGKMQTRYNKDTILDAGNMVKVPEKLHDQYTVGWQPVIGPISLELHEESAVYVWYPAWGGFVNELLYTNDQYSSTTKPDFYIEYDVILDTETLQSDITIDGTLVEEITIDGQNVQEVTIDGTAVFTEQIDYLYRAGDNIANFTQGTGTGTNSVTWGANSVQMYVEGHGRGYIRTQIDVTDVDAIYIDWLGSSSYTSSVSARQMRINVTSQDTQGHSSYLVNHRTFMRDRTFSRQTNAINVTNVTGNVWLAIYNYRVPSGTQTINIYNIYTKTFD